MFAIKNPGINLSWPASKKARKSRLIRQINLLKKKIWTVKIRVVIITKQ